MPRKEDAVWSRFAGVYDRFMKKDMDAYRIMIDKIIRTLSPNKKVLEVATGTGFIALGISNHLKQIDAVDFSPEMIGVAKTKAQKKGISNIRFGVQDATALSFPSSSFDAVIIANTLHIMPESEKALGEIRRVLKTDGKLIAPTFVHAGSRKAALLSRLMSITGFHAYHKWTQQSYHAFLKKNGFAVLDAALLNASFPLAYVAAEKIGE